ncbi:hypothetical protein MCUN1_000742 [Malassezia cuniculi]|uniref:N-acetyltransferase domain-containing protein n=1 Tax=Malassezia cuniculi TaxID=948313 RepID=A0AAF0JA28_9BASI|nr:hypothetical protein MCUN1_000742 [Malassezia cuniculi]
MPYTVKLADRAELLKQGFDLRTRVFGQEQGLDGVATPFVVVDENDVVHGVMRLIPYPLPEVPEPVPGMNRWEDARKPGMGRTEQDFIAAYKAHVKVSMNGDRKLLSGAKIGRVAVDKTLRGTGMGSKLIKAAEEWLVGVMATLPEAAGPCDVQLRLESQVIASEFYSK